MLNGRNVSSQNGFSLIETMISLALTSVLLLGVARLTVFEMVQYRSFSERDFLQQQVSITLDILRQELLKAGYNDKLGVSAVVSESSGLVVVNEKNNAFAFTYLDEESGSEYRTIAYQFKDKKLLLCEKTTNTLISFTQALDSNKDAPCYSVFDVKSILVDEMSVKTVTLSNSSDVPVLDVLIFIISVSLASNPEVTLIKTLEQPVRNWR